MINYKIENKTDNSPDFLSLKIGDYFYVNYKYHTGFDDIVWRKIDGNHAMSVRDKSVCYFGSAGGVYEHESSAYNPNVIVVEPFGDLIFLEK